MFPIFIFRTSEFIQMIILLSKVIEFESPRYPGPKSPRMRVQGEERPCDHLGQGFRVGNSRVTTFPLLQDGIFSTCTINSYSAFKSVADPGGGMGAIVISGFVLLLCFMKDCLGNCRNKFKSSILAIQLYCTH